MKVKPIVRTFLKNNFTSARVETLMDNESLLEKGILDSTAVLELLEFLEENFMVRIEDDEVVPENLDSLDRIESFIISKTSNLRRGSPGS